MKFNFEKLLEKVQPGMQRGYKGFGWVVRVRGEGLDKSDYQITRVCEYPGFDGDVLTHVKSGRKIKRNGAIIHKHREDARKQKKEQHLWKYSSNYWSNVHYDW